MKIATIFFAKTIRLFSLMIIYTCVFLREDGNCKLSVCKPDSCKKYPYTDQPERLSSLLSVLDVIEICPVAFEIFERLKEEYRFRLRR